MFNYLSKVLSNIHYFLKDNLVDSLHFTTPVSLVAAFVFSVGYLLFSETEVWWLDGLGTLLSLLVFASTYNFILKRQHTYLYWGLFLLFLSFNGTYLVLLEPNSTTNAAGLMIALMMFTILLNNALLLLLILSIGSFIAYCTYTIIISSVVFTEHTASTWAVYLIGLIWGMALSHKKLIMEKKREGMFTLAHQLAHELNTPLMAIKTSCLTIQKFMPRLIQAYQIAKEKQIELPQPIAQQALDGLQPLAQEVSDECTAVSHIMRIIIMNAKDIDRLKSQYVNVSIYHCIEEALKRYPFPQTFDNRTQIHWEKLEDFNFKGIELLIIHVFLNLIKNAVYAILKADKGEIYISNRSDKHFNYLYFKDTGCGIPPENMANLFKSFFTTHEKGTGLGLFFCKNVMKGLGGDISCQSVYGKETIFTLKFPKKP